MNSASSEFPANPTTINTIPPTGQFHSYQDNGYASHSNANRFNNNCNAVNEQNDSQVGYNHSNNSQISTGSWRHALRSYLARVLPCQRQVTQLELAKRLAEIQLRILAALVFFAVCLVFLYDLKHYHNALIPFIICCIVALTTGLLFFFYYLIKYLSSNCGYISGDEETKPSINQIRRHGYGTIIGCNDANSVTNSSPVAVPVAREFTDRFTPNDNELSASLLCRNLNRLLSTGRVLHDGDHDFSSSRLTVSQNSDGIVEIRQIPIPDPTSFCYEALPNSPPTYPITDDPSPRSTNGDFSSAACDFSTMSTDYDDEFDFTPQEIKEVLIFDRR